MVAGCSPAVAVAVGLDSSAVVVAVEHNLGYSSAVAVAVERSLGYLPVVAGCKVADLGH